MHRAGRVENVAAVAWDRAITICLAEVRVWWGMDIGEADTSLGRNALAALTLTEAVTKTTIRHVNAGVAFETLLKAIPNGAVTKTGKPVWTADTFGAAAMRLLHGRAVVVVEARFESTPSTTMKFVGARRDLPSVVGRVT